MQLPAFTTTGESAGNIESDVCIIVPYNNFETAFVAATSEEEHAVSMAILGPRRSRM